MDTVMRGVYEDEVERMDCLLIAAEKWASGYKSNRETYNSIIKSEARLARLVRSVFRTVALDVDKYINWSQYQAQLSQVKAAREPLKADVDVSVIVSEDLYDDTDGLFFTITFENISTAMAIGAQAGELIYKIPLGIRSSDAIIQQLTTERLAFLVGKRVDKSGNVVDNPKSEYRISDKTRQDIASNIRTGIALGEDKQTMTKRLQRVIQDPKRAERIAQTETVNAYGAGMHEFGKESGATGKEWENVGAVDVCQDNTLAGVIPLDQPYPSGDMHPGAHTGCRCNERLAYANEFPA